MRGRGLALVADLSSGWGWTSPGTARRCGARSARERPGAYEASSLDAWGDLEEQTVSAEADAYCRDRQLLTLATPPDVGELRAWVLGSSSAQLDDGRPRPWAGPLD